MNTEQLAARRQRPSSTSTAVREESPSMAGPSARRSRPPGVSSPVSTNEMTRSAGRGEAVLALVPLVHELLRGEVADDALRAVGEEQRGRRELVETDRHRRSSTRGPSARTWPRCRPAASRCRRSWRLPSRVGFGRYVRQRRLPSGNPLVPQRRLVGNAVRAGGARRRCRCDEGVRNRRKRGHVPETSPSGEDVTSGCTSGCGRCSCAGSCARSASR